MENDSEVLRAWVRKQMADLDAPADWRPDAGAARVRFRARVTADRRRAAWRRWTVWAAAAMLALALVWLLPVGRVTAQQLWQLLTVRRVTLIRVNPWPEGVPSPQVKLMGTPIPPLPARDVDEVRQRVGYAPRLPHAGVLSGGPQFLTTFSLSAGTVVHAADLQLALRQAGVAGLSVPPAWDGAQLALHTSAIAMAEWPDAMLAQSLPLTLSAPAGFDYAAFSALLLRVMGVGAEDAERLAQRMGTAPLAPITPELAHVAAIEEIELNSGPATLVQQRGTPARTTVFWSVPDRVYLLTGTLSRDLAIAVANAVE